MALPDPTRVYPDADDDSPMGGTPYTDVVKSNSERLYKMLGGVVGSVSGSNTITGTCTPPLSSAPTHGQVFVMTPVAANTGAVTVNLDSTGAKALVSKDTTALASGDLATTDPLTFMYDGVLGKYRLLNLTAAQIAALVASAATGANLWQPIGHYVFASGGGDNEKILSWTADDYSKVFIVGGGISSTVNVTLTFAIRTSAGTVTNTLAFTASAAQAVSFDAEWINDLSGTATRRTILKLRSTKDAAVQAETANANSSTNIASQFRISVNTGAFDAGRIDAYGLTPAG